MSQILYETDLDLMEDITKELKQTGIENGYGINNVHEFALNLSSNLGLSRNESRIFLTTVLSNSEETCKLFSPNSKNYSINFVHIFSKFLKYIDISENSDIIYYAKLINKDDFQYPFKEQIKLDFPESLESRLFDKEKRHITFASTNLIQNEGYDLTKIYKTTSQEELIENITTSLKEIMKIFPSQREFANIFTETQNSELTTTHSKISTVLNGSWLRYVGKGHYNTINKVKENRLKFISDFYCFLGISENSEIINLTRSFNPIFNYDLKSENIIKEMPIIYNLEKGNYKEKKLDDSQKKVLNKMIDKILISKNKYEE